jgi:hypothetical protein
MSDRIKVCCQERRCDWHGYADEMLSAADPFNEGETLTACPECKTVENNVHTACDEPDCWRAATSGTLTDNGYRNTCYDHSPTRYDMLTARKETT